MAVAIASPLEDLRERLNVLFEGTREKCLAGTPDVVSMKYGKLIEIRDVGEYEDGLKKLTAYSSQFPMLIPTLYVFGSDEAMEKADWEAIKVLCFRMNIKLMRDDEDYADIEARRRKDREMTVHEFAESQCIDGEAESEAEVSRDRTNRFDMKRQQKAICQHYATLIDSLHRFPIEAIETRVKITQIIREIEQTRDQFDALSSTINDAGRVAANFIADQIIFDDQANVPLVIYKSVMKTWHKHFGYDSLINEVRRRAWEFFIIKGVSLRTDQEKGTTIFGIRLKHDPRKDQRKPI